MDSGRRDIEITLHNGDRKLLCLMEDEQVCKHCKGRGRWESCFDCGNRGHTLSTRALAEVERLRREP
jgi:DnaJ-class molecular chaperone